MRRYRRVLTAGTIVGVIGLALFGSFVIRSARATSASSPIVVDVGDLIHVAQTHISCGVVRRSTINAIQCLAPPPLRGTYGTVMSDRRVQVIRFRNNTTAKIVFTATQKRASSTCRQGR